MFDVKRESHALTSDDNSSDSARILVILLRSRTRCSITEKLSPRSARGHAYFSFGTCPAVYDVFRSICCARMSLKLYSRVVCPRNNPSKSQISVCIYYIHTYTYTYALYGHFGFQCLMQILFAVVFTENNAVF